MMKRSVSLGTLGLAALLTAACSSGSSPADGGQGQGGTAVTFAEARSAMAFDEAPAPPAADYAAFVSGTNDLGFDLFRKLGPEGNFIYSPLSTATALAMTYAGARGSTASQMKAVLHDSLGQDAYAAAYNKLMVDLAARSVALHATEQGDKSLKLHLVDAAFAQTGYAFVPAYLDTLAVHYDAGVKLLDFAADADGSRQLINHWVAGETEQKIKDLLPQGSISVDTRLVLANALYFYGSWVTPFDKNATADAPFHAKGGDVQAPTMHVMAPAPYAEGDGYKVAELGYDGGKLAMTIVLPDDGKLAALEAALSGAWLSQAAKDMAAYQGGVFVSLPKFKFTWGTTSLADSLKALGMSDAFSNPPADFSGIEPGKELFISDVFHKAFVGVDESGTEAAAATAVVMDRESALPDTKAFDVDRPFLFVVRDTESGAVLFVGKVEDPTK